jgi:hypothetical protein
MILLISKKGKYMVHIQEVYIPKLDRYGYHVKETNKFFISFKRAIHHARVFLKIKRKKYVEPTPRRVRNRI